MRPGGGAGDPIRRFTQALLRDPRDQSCPHAQHVVLAEVVADAERVDARLERTDGRLLDADGRADGLHLERVGEHEPVEPERLSEQTLHDASAEGRRCVVERGNAHMRRHDRLHAGRDRGAERLEPVLDVAGDRGQLEV